MADGNLRLFPDLPSGLQANESLDDDTVVTPTSEGAQL